MARPIQGTRAKTARTIPADPLLEAIPLSTRDVWRRNPTPELIRRLEFLCASGPRPSDDLAAMRILHCRAVRAAWETYVTSAFACGLFEGDRGKELRGRFASRAPEDFRSAMAECRACWFLAGPLGFDVYGKAQGRGAKILDMGAAIQGRQVGVEVKAPYRERPPSGEAWSGHDSDLLVRCLEGANKQFSDDCPNLLVLAPKLRTPVSMMRVQLVTALYGEEKITCPIDMRTGGPAGPVTTEFFPEGLLLRRCQPSGALIKPDGKPGYTRVSAVITIEERMEERYPHPISTLDLDADDDYSSDALRRWNRGWDLHHGRDNFFWVEHDVLVAHNPHAHYPLSSDLFGGHVQFRDMGPGYGWSDGELL